MKKTEAEEFLGTAIATPLSKLGFAQADHLYYIRRKDALSATLGIGGRLVDQQTYWFSYVAGVRHEALSVLLDSSEDAPWKPTLLVPHHFLEKDHAYYQWKLSVPTESEQQIAAMMEHISVYAIPFWNSITGIEDIKRKLDDPVYGKQLSLEPTQRLCLQIALEFLMGRKDQAQQMARKAIIDRKNELPKKIRPLEHLLTRIS